MNFKIMGLLNKDSVFLSKGLIDSTIMLHRIGSVGGDIPDNIAGAVGSVAAVLLLEDCWEVEGERVVGV